VNIGDILRQLVQGAMDIPPYAKQGIISLLDQLPESYKQTLYTLIRTSTSAGIGAIITTFLVGHGGIGAAAGLALQSQRQYATPAQISYHPFL